MLRLIPLCTALLTLSCVTWGHDVIERASPTQDPAALAHLTALTDALSAKLTALTAQEASLKANLTSQSSAISVLNTRYNHDNAVLLNVSRELRTTGNTLDKLDTYVRNTVASLTLRTTNLARAVGFTVRLVDDAVTENTTTTVQGHWERVLFDYVVTQVGGENYNTSTGYFTAPSSGTYAFFLTVQRNDPQGDDCVEANVVNGRSVVLAATACPSGFSSASNAGVVHLRHGDQVSVQTRNNDRINGHTHTSFSGFKVSPH